MGTFLGTGLTYMMTMYFRNIDGTDAMATLPGVPILCPAFTETYYVVDEGLKAK